MVRTTHTWLSSAQWWLLALVLLSILLFIAPPVPAAETPMQAVETTVTEAVAVLQDPQYKNGARAEDRIVRLKQIADARFDYAEMGKRSLGAHWKKLSDREQQQFVELFTELLTATYADKIDSYSGERVKYLDERREGENYAEVRTKMIGKKTEIPVNYRLIKKDDAWQAYDVVIDGVSLVKNYRGQFASILRSSSFEQLVEALREKIKTYQDPTKLSKSHASTRQN